MSRIRFSFHPKLVDALVGYNRSRFFNDISAGVTVGIVALPLAMAFAIAAGTKPEAGLFTAIIGGFLVSAFGGSRVQIGGPAGAFIMVVYGIIEKYGIANLVISTILAGAILFTMGMLRLGTMIRHIPVPIILGFTNGIAVLIALSQIKDFLGLNIDKMPGDFFAQIKLIFTHLQTINFVTVTIALLSLAIIFSWPKLFLLGPNGQPRAVPDIANPLLRFIRAIPGTIIVLIIGTLAVSWFHFPVETIGTKFGGVPQNLPTFSVPDFSWELIKQLFTPTLTIALLGAIESLLCARIADNIIDDRHDPNQELMAQGIANCVTPFFGGIPTTGTIARTVTNIRSGATSPIAGIVHAITLLMIVLVAAPLAKNVPLGCLAAILLYVAYNMGEWREFQRLKHFSMTYRVLMLSTFLLTVIVDLTVAVEVGLVLSCLFFIYRISALTKVEPIPETELPQALPAGVIAYSVFGSLFFGTVDKLEELANERLTTYQTLILDLNRLINLDTTGLETLSNLHKSLQKQKCQLILCCANEQPLSLMQRTNFFERLSIHHYSSLLQAIEHV